MKATIATLLAAVAALTLGAAQAAEDFGMIMDTEGDVEVRHEGQSAPADFGQTIYIGDNIRLGANARVLVVSYTRCDELILQGPVEAEADWTGLTADQPEQPQKGRRLPVCYSQEELNVASSGVIGGLVLRGAPSDPVLGLREEFKQGQASNVSLMTLIMHDVANGNPERAAPYYQTLKDRMPESAFITSMAKYFP